MSRTRAQLLSRSRRTRSMTKFKPGPSEIEKTVNRATQKVMAIERDSMRRIFADKINCKKWLSTNFEFTMPETHGVITSEKEFEFSELPKRFIMKPAHGSGPVAIIGGGHSVRPTLRGLQSVWRASAIYLSYPPEGTVGQELLRLMVRQWLTTDYNSGDRLEWAYSHLKRRIIVEELVGDDPENAPVDVKVYCFEGKPFLVEVDEGRFSGHIRNFYDPTGAFLCDTDKFPGMCTPLASELFSASVGAAAKLSNGSSFLRVDFLVDSQAMYVGELTNYPGGANADLPPEDVCLAAIDRFAPDLLQFVGRSGK